MLNSAVPGPRLVDFSKDQGDQYGRKHQKYGQLGIVEINQQEPGAEKCWLETVGVPRLDMAQANVPGTG